MGNPKVNSWLFAGGIGVALATAYYDSTPGVILGVGLAIAGALDHGLAEIKAAIQAKKE